MTVLGVIPARGGSKGIPRKNLAPLAGRSLLAWTAEAVRGSSRLTRTIVSTEDEDIAAAARALGLEVPFLRPPSLAADDTPMVDVLRNAVETLRDAGGFDTDVVVLLQPTSPLRTSTHIDAAVGLLAESGADSVVSVVEVPHQFNPVSVMKLEDGRLVPYAEGRTVTRRQDKPRLYSRNGPAVLVVRASCLVGQGSLFGNDCRPFIMSERESIDIDTAWDLELAEWVLMRTWTSGEGRS
ncbi:MAG: acylneuraminate cytidylyltransferase family protein [Acidobacteriota bacterium]